MGSLTDVHRADERGVSNLDYFAAAEPPSTSALLLLSRNVS
jgi:hypothetical protein